MKCKNRKKEKGLFLFQKRRQQTREQFSKNVVVEKKGEYVKGENKKRAEKGESNQRESSKKKKKINSKRTTKKETHE